MSAVTGTRHGRARSRGWAHGLSNGEEASARSTAEWGELSGDRLGHERRNQIRRMWEKLSNVFHCTRMQREEDCSLKGIGVRRGF